MNQLILCYENIRRKLSGEDGIGTVELVLILFVLIGVVIIFKNNIVKLVTEYFDKMDPKFVHP